jgi:serine/threonine-protein kinase
MGNPCGKLLGRYEIVAEIGRGAMGAVYKGWDPKIERSVAIKTILLNQTGAPEQREFRKRFFLEAQAAGRLLHPGIVALFDVGEEPETSNPYIVMEYIEGLTLADLCANNSKKLPLDDALRLTMEIAEALDYAHAQGVVHRDIKPANVLVTKDGQAKIADFGIAQLDLSHMTMPGRVLGTPAYMSPEQLEGEQVDGRSDLFSLGAILYAALTGFSPFQGNSPTTVCFKVANRAPMQPTALAPELPAELDAVIARALAKAPADRYQRGREFARDLRELRKRANPHNGPFWFSASEGRPTWLDSSLQAASPSPPAREGAVSPAISARPLRNQSSIFSPWRFQAAVLIPLFLAALVVSFFAWRQIRSSRTFARRAAPAVNQAAVTRAALPATVEKDLAPSTGPDVTAAPPESTVPVPEPADPPATDPPAIPSATKPSVPKSGVAKARLIKPAVVPLAATQLGAMLASRRVAATNAPTGSTPAAGSPAIADSNVEIHIENHFANATLLIWVDDKLVYQHPLHDGHRHRLILLGGGTKETLTLPVPAGKHALRVQVRSEAEQYDQTRAVDGEFVKGGERILSINFDKRSKEMRAMLAEDRGVVKNP